ncbi:DUF6346 domain-containing protein [Amycolatopsis sp. NPDC059657]|uniref:DUF6346 domain-containing protein n=1 Tax=Amycolatopsis sp. NPDC059657 TaxID=3346899 RepID=UPI003672B5EC
MTIGGNEGMPAAGQLKRSTVIRAVLIGIVAVAICWTAAGHAASFHSEEKPDKPPLGVAYAKSCVEKGPLTEAGIGFFWACTAEAHWQGGLYNRDVKTVVFGLDELTPADIGKPVTFYKYGKRYWRHAERPYEGPVEWSVAGAEVLLIGGGYWLWRRKHPKAPRVVVRKYKSEVRLPSQPSIVDGFAERSSKIYPRADPMARRQAWLRVSSSGIEWYRSSRAKFEVDWTEIAKVRLTTVTDAAGEVIRVVDVFPSKEFRRRDVEMSGLWESGALLGNATLPIARGAYRLPEAFKERPAEELREILRGVQPGKFEEIKAEV